MKTTILKKAKNILLVTSSNFPFGGAGANVLRLFTLGLVRAGRNVSVLIQRGNQYGKIVSVNRRQGVIKGVHYLYCGYLLRPQNYLKKIIDDLAGIFIPPLIAIKKKISKKIDCVIVYNKSIYFNVILLIVCKVFKIPIINHIVEWYDKESVVTSWWKLFKWWDYLLFMKILSKHFDGLIVTSTFLKEYYSGKFNTENILILPNLVDISIFDSRKGDDIISSKSIRIGYCGTPTRKDGINDLLLAFQIVQRRNLNSELFIIGDATGNNSLLPELEKISRKLGILEKITFTGLVEWERVPGLLNSCDILVLARPSGRFARAGFPTKLGEYMACKKPVVVTTVGDIPIYLKDKENAMLAEPDNPESVASKLFYLIENLERAKDIGRNGYLWAKNKLDYVKSIQVVGKFLDMFMK